MGARDQGPLTFRGHPADVAGRLASAVAAMTAGPAADRPPVERVRDGVFFTVPDALPRAELAVDAADEPLTFGSVDRRRGRRIWL